MADYRNVPIKATELEASIILDDVSQDGSINPRACLSDTYIDDYEKSIVDYLVDGQDFNQVWGQRPQAVETDEDGKYLLTSGYHTITALINIVNAAMNDPDREIDRTRVGNVDTDFEVIIQVKKVNKSIDYKDAARFHASFSNVHGQPLTPGEKAKAAYNALSVMNLTKDEGDETLFPYKTERELASMLGIGKGTIHRVKKQVNEERWGVAEEPETPETPADADSDTVGDAVSDIESLDAESQAKADAEADMAKENGEDADAEDADAGNGDINYSEGDDEEEDEDDPLLNAAQNASDKKDPANNGETNNSVDSLNLNFGGEDESDEDAEKDAEEKESKKLKANLVDFISKASLEQLRTSVELREVLDFTLECDANELSKAYSSVGQQISGARKNYSKLAVNKDPEYSGAIDRVFGIIQKLLEVLGNENDERP